MKFYNMLTVYLISLITHSAGPARAAALAAPHKAFLITARFLYQFLLFLPEGNYKTKLNFVTSNKCHQKQFWAVLTYQISISEKTPNRRHVF